jgi:hypothetical protein
MYIGYGFDFVAEILLFYKFTKSQNEDLNIP